MSRNNYDEFSKIKRTMEKGRTGRSYTWVEFFVYSETLCRRTGYIPGIQFYDVGALGWFARIIEWEFPGFSVESCMERLCEAQTILEKQGAIEASTHRYLIAAMKPENGV